MEEKKLLSFLLPLTWTGFILLCFSLIRKFHSPHKHFADEEMVNASRWQKKILSRNFLWTGCLWKNRSAWSVVQDRGRKQRKKTLYEVMMESSKPCLLQEPLGFTRCWLTELSLHFVGLTVLFWGQTLNSHWSQNKQHGVSWERTKLPWTSQWKITFSNRHCRSN